MMLSFSEMEYFFHQIGCDDCSTSTDSWIAVHENIGALNILVDKLEGYIEELCNLLLGRVIDREVQIARNMLLGVIEEKSSASSHNGFNFMFSIKELPTT